MAEQIRINKDPSTDPLAFTIRDMEDEVDKQQVSDLLWKLVDDLEPLEQQILYLVYEHGLTSDLIGFISQDGLTQEKIEKAKEAALAKLRSSQKLRDFLGYPENDSDSE